MKAAFTTGYGGSSVVALRDVPRPVPADDGVLIRIEAASVNRADLDALGPRPGFLRLFLGLRAPRNPRLGCDAAGTVEAVGKDVTRFRPGDRVFADLFPYGQGAFAEYAAAPERAFLPIPDGLSFEEAATLPHAAILAIQALRLRSGRTIKAGDRVLIVGASGSVGPFAVQIAKSLGAEVTGVCRTAKVDLVRSIGADHVIDYEMTDYTTTGERYDWMVDVDGHYSLLAARRSVRRGGVYVVLGGSTVRLLEALLVGPAVTLAQDKSMGLMLWWKPFHPPDVERLTDLIAAGQMRPVIDRRFPLDDIVAALRHVEVGAARGKVIIAP
jgi:NADPH:quinone reductase-like Zn-dependent oxidoreductase